MHHHWQMKLHALPLIAVLAATVANAEECPPAPDHVEDVDLLISQVQQAPSEQAAREISGLMWELWRDAPDEDAQAMLDRGMARIQRRDLSGAIQEFDRLIDYCPSYAEGYNQRAFANYLRSNFKAALVDLDRAIELSPNHVAAISGRALTLLGLHRIDQAREALDEALVLNPWLAERHLAGPGGPLEPPGEDI